MYTLIHCYLYLLKIDLHLGLPMASEYALLPPLNLFIGVSADPIHGFTKLLHDPLIVRYLIFILFLQYA